MKFITLLGGIASGKSTVAKQLHGLGAAIIDGDEISHEVLCIPEIVDQMKMRWKDRLRLKGHGIDQEARRRIAQIVFGEPVELAFLEAITWPPMRRRMLEKISLYHPDYTPAMVIDFPLMIESGFHNEFAGMQFWYVNCASEVRFENFKNRREKAGILESKQEAWITFQARGQRQADLMAKLERSSVVINNDMTPKVQEEVEAAWKKHVLELP